MADTLSSGGSGVTRVRSNRIIRTIMKDQTEIVVQRFRFLFLKPLKNNVYLKLFNI